MCVIKCVMFLIQTFGHKNGSRKFNPLGVLIMESLCNSRDGMIKLNCYYDTTPVK